MANDDLSELTADIVSAFVSNNLVTAGALPNLIVTTYSALKSLGEPTVEAEPKADLPTPAQIRRSVQDDGIVSFLDGKKYKSMKRHLTVRGITPAEYRERYSLPKDYPMVAPSYARARSALAKSMGLGQKGRGTKEVAPVPKTRKPRARA